LENMRLGKATAAGVGVGTGEGLDAGDGQRHGCCRWLCCCR
jgi:hypothetical protein